VLWFWHVPAAYAEALASDAVFWTMQLSILASAVLLWRRVLAPADAHGAGHVAAGLVGTILQMGFLGALITFAGRPLYEPHLLTTGPWGLSPLEDGKIDAIPGHVNVIRLRADRAGTYRGQCAEFCGSGHAGMGFQVRVSAYEATGEGGGSP
jgi:cytochrome c oxidase assembly factor CtaG